MKSVTLEFQVFVPYLWKQVVVVIVLDSEWVVWRSSQALKKTEGTFFIYLDNIDQILIFLYCLVTLDNKFLWVDTLLVHFIK